MDKIKKQSEFVRVMKQMSKNKLAILGLIILLTEFVLVLLAPVIAPYDYAYMDVMAMQQGPSAAHWFGTDELGRDIFSRVLGGAGTSFLVALAVVAIGCVFGLLIGGLCGYYGGVADAILTRLCDTLTAFPSVLLALVILSLTKGGTYNIILVLGILFIPSFARVVRAEFARCKEQNYVKSARLMGASDLRIMALHILPNIMQVLLPSITIGFNNAILSEASMSFLGLGIQPPEASLGSMLSDSQTYLLRAPWYALCTGGTMVLLILGFSMLGEGISQSDRRK